MKPGELLSQYFTYRENKKGYSDGERSMIRQSFKDKIAKGLDNYLDSIDRLNRVD